MRQILWRKISCEVFFAIDSAPKGSRAVMPLGMGEETGTRIGIWVSIGRCRFGTSGKEW